MNLWETFKLALKNIAGSKMRTFLTMLGIIIGVSAVILIVGLGNGIEIYMRDQFAALGTNSLNVTVTGRGGSARSASVQDLYDIVAGSPEYLDKVSPTVRIMGGVRVGTESYSATSVTGVSEDYFSMKAYDVGEGRGIRYMDVADRKNVCVVGCYVNDTYYAGRAVGDTIRVGGNKLTIVGVMAPEADEPEEGGTDDCVYLPYSTAARLSHMGTIVSYTVTIVDEDYATQAKNVIENGLYKIFEDTDAYSVISMTEILDMMSSMLNIVITILAIIAGISLVVGGIGIMNIMLVSVTERTREIGIRKALGAKEGTILWQFVLEAATTSAIGGSIGIGLGYALSSFATTIIQAAFHEPLVVSPSAGSVLMAFGISAGIGVLFGFLPANKAAQLNPIDALRYE